MMHRPRSIERTRFLVLAAIVAAGFGVRAWGLSEYAITHWDEGAIWSGAKWFATLGAEGSYSTTTSPPLVPLLLGLAALPFGLDPKAAIWLSAITGTAVIVLMYLLVSRLASPRAGLLAAGLLAFSGLHVMYSRLLLTETFYGLFLILALLSTVEYLRTRTLGWLVLTAASAICLQFTKYNGFLIAAPLLAAFAVTVLRGADAAQRQRALRHGLLLGSAIAAAVASNLLALVAVEQWESFVDHYSRYVGGALDPGTLLAYSRLTLPFPVLYAALAAVVFTVWKRRTAPWTVFHVAFLLYVWFTFSYTFYLRLLLPLSIFLIAYAATMIDVLAGARPRWVWRTAVLVLGVSVGLSTYGDLPRYLVREFGGYTKAATVLERLGERAPVLLITQHHVWPERLRSLRFLPNTPRHRLEIPPGTRHVFVVSDIYMYYKYGGRHYVPSLESFRHRIVARVANPLPYDVLENNLTLSELARLETDAAFRDRILSITVFDLTREEAQQALTRGSQR